MPYFPTTTAPVAIDRDDLNDFMTLDRVIRVHDNGMVSDSPISEWFDDVCDLLDEDGNCTDLTGGAIEGLPDGWQLLTGFSGQWAYRGPDFHTSEYIGGGLARHILETPGDYVALVARGVRENGYPDTDEGEEMREDDYGYAWWIAYRPVD